MWTQFSKARCNARAIEFGITAQLIYAPEDHLSGPLSNRGEYGQSLPLAIRGLAIHPEDGNGHYGLFQTYAFMGKYPEAVKELQQTVKLYGFPEFAPPLDRAFAAAGFQAAMRVWAADLEKEQRNGRIYVPSSLAEAYAILGDKDRAIYWLEDSYRHKYSLGADGGMLWLKGDPFYISLRSDPRFKDLVRRVGLPE